MKEEVYVNNNDLAKSLDILIKDVNNLSKYVNIDKELISHLSPKKALVEKLKNPEFNVVFLGSFSSGKSTLINALLEKEVLPESTKATTAVPTYIRFKERVKSDNAVKVTYLNQSGKDRLRELYIKEIAERFDKNNLKIDLDGKTSEKQVEILNKTKKDSTKYEGKDLKIIDELIRLLNEWDTERQEEYTSYNKLTNYVAEASENILFIDKVEIDIENTDNQFDPNIVLVDLPGLGVSNPRHQEITKQIIEETSKAIIVCMKPKHLLEGEEINLIDRISRMHPQILRKAFWVINQWDTLTDKQKEEEKQNFEEKLKEKRIDIELDRVYQVSALKYFILKLKESDQLKYTIKLKEHAESFKDLDSNEVNSSEETKNFDVFKNHLLDHMQKNAYKEYSQGIREELIGILNKLKSNIDIPEKEISLEKHIQVRTARKSKEKYDQLVSEFNKFIEYVLVDARNYLYRAEDLWTEEISKTVLDEISLLLDNIDEKKFLSKLTEGADILSQPHRAPSIIEKELQIGNLIRKQMISIMEGNFYKVYIESLSTYFKEAVAIPQAMLKQVDNALEIVYIKERTIGLTDALLVRYSMFLDYALDFLPKHHYSSDIDRKYSSRSSTSFESMLSSFKNNLNYLINEDFKKEANNYLRMMLKNYIENITTNLKKLWKENEKEIFMNLSLTIETNTTESDQIEKKLKAIENYEKSLKQFEKELNIK